ncbi:SIS domain-containing protein [PVC group bacterium]|nr:SIS domain-containing protein [PVC group bacterium]
MSSKRNDIVKSIERDVDLKQQMIQSNVDDIYHVFSVFVEILKNNGKIVFFGNGGSAADAMHLAAEFIGRFKKDRLALPALALTSNPAVLTCLANDYGYDHIFARQIEGLVDVKDVCVGLTTSGRSQNVILGLERARTKGASTMVWTGSSSQGLEKCADHLLIIPSDDTALIQQGMMLVGHLICEMVENEMFPK